MNLATAQQTAVIVCGALEAELSHNEDQSKCDASKTKAKRGSRATAKSASAVVSTVRPKAKKPKRRSFVRVALGLPLVVTDGCVERWAEEIEVFNPWPNKQWVRIEEADQYQVVIDRWIHKPYTRRVRILDEEGFPLSAWTGLVETSREVCQPDVIKFEVGQQPLPVLIRKAKPRDLRLHPQDCVAGHRLIYAEPPRPPKPEIEWFPATDREKKRELVASLPNAPEYVVAALSAPAPEVEPLPDKWFQIVIPEVAMQDHHWNMQEDNDTFEPPDARKEFPNGWCARLVAPQPETGVLNDPDWAYVQCTHHYWVLDWVRKFVWKWVFDPNVGRERKVKAEVVTRDRVFRTDAGDEGEGRVERGIWIPRALLQPISIGQADEIYDLIVEGRI